MAQHKQSWCLLCMRLTLPIFFFDPAFFCKRQQPLVIQILSQNRKISYTLLPVKMLQAIVLTCLSVISYSDLAL